MHPRTSLPLLIVFCILTLALLIYHGSASPHQLVERQASLQFLFQALATLVALLSAALLLFRAAGGENFRNLLPLTLPALAAVMILSPHWPFAIAFGLVGAAHLIGDRCGKPAEREAQDVQRD